MLKSIFRALLSTTFLILLCCSCAKQPQAPRLPFLVVLGIAQDAGYPQAGCRKSCCARYWAGKEERCHVTCLGIVDPLLQQTWILEATPDFVGQLHQLQEANGQNITSLSGIFLTHAHIGHYAGLIHLGREVMGTQGVPVYVMPRMESFLRNNGPWSQLVSLNNISLKSLSADSLIALTPSLSVKPMVVPHRDEFSETLGFVIAGPNKKVLFIPDINKWELWEQSIIEEIKKVDIAFIDGTFFKNGEIPGRDMKEIPHPFIEESLLLFAQLPHSERRKVHFIHLNHTNPVLMEGPEKEWVLQQGCKVAWEGQRIVL